MSVSRSDAQTLKCLDGQMLGHLNGWTLRWSDAQTLGHSDTQRSMVSCPVNGQMLRCLTDEC